jgi:diguanylate cyclase (GGDEF)-like protein
MPADLSNGVLLFLQCLVYFSFMAVLFRLRGKLGLGVLTCALGTLHFLETYLASVFYVATPIGVVSPGSSVLFSGKLLILLMIYIKEDAATVRQPIYGILAGNLLTLVLAFVLRFHDIFVFAPGAQSQVAFIQTIGALMVWGTTLLFIDAIALVLLYEKLGRWFRKDFFLRVLVALAAVLTFDQAGFYLALRWVAGVPIEAFYAGLIAKACAAFVFSALAAMYMRFIEPQELRLTPPLTDVFQALTYRERFEELAQHTGRDRTTMLLNRQSFTRHFAGRHGLADAPGDITSLLLIEVDAVVFDDIDSRLGRLNSEALLRTVSRCLEDVLHDRDEAFRLDHRQFAIVFHSPPRLALAMVERLRSGLRQRSDAYGRAITVSVGIAGMPAGSDADETFALAEARLAEARLAGGDATRMTDPVAPPTAFTPAAAPAPHAP